MAKLIMMKGLPASGKTTIARELMNKHGNYVRVNRDDLRSMLHNKWSGRNEGITVDMEKAIVRSVLNSGNNIIVDDTNLGQKHEDMWKGIAEECDAKFEVRVADKGVFTCVEHDMDREKCVGRDVIIQMALQYELYPKPKKPFVLCDIDGTIADGSHREKYTRGTYKNWEKYFSLMDKDEPRLEVMQRLEKLDKEGFEIILISARPEKYREVTENWLVRCGGFDYLTIIMRGNYDRRPDYEVKMDIYNRFFKGKYDIHCVFDDRPQVLVKVWRQILNDVENKFKIYDVGNPEKFLEERQELNYWS